MVSNRMMFKEVLAGLPRLLMVLIVFVAVWGIAVPGPALADKSEVVIDAPNEVSKGEDVTVILHVSHRGNSFFHRTSWVELRVNGQLANRWEYSMFDRPPDENFSVSFSMPAETDLELEAEANCNIHGSENVARKTIVVK